MAAKTEPRPRPSCGRQPPQKQATHSPCAGCYTRPGTHLTWQGVVSSLQNISRTDLSVGGLTALELHGFAHYLPLSRRRAVHLYGKDPLPRWVAAALPEAVRSAQSPSRARGYRTRQLRVRHKGAISHHRHGDTTPLCLALHAVSAGTGLS
ncbi:AbiEi antitoxin N-terminal domain-containing protein [Mesorhizobium sp. BE184]|uniref:AbiEi antitoxin N-terminal domain-containing protein n=1 Tax=Mesorhizobium sp. BE184 TaxID=2817714 RepID=UPI00286A71AA|nr:AbiEi antitoxin N-terminal domain-containing protein [Mesorhizobium sp. BE184]